MSRAAAVDPAPQLPRPTAAAASVRRYGLPPPPCPIDLHLDGNEGARPDASLWRGLGDDAAAVRALLRDYPSPRRLARLVAERWHVDESEVLVTAGGDEALDRVFRAHLGPGRNVVLPEPTFAMLRRYAQLAGAEIRSVAWRPPAYPRADVLAAIDRDTGVIPVVSPNNPTGAVASADDLDAIAVAAPGAVVVLDAAYGEFADDDLTAAALRRARPNVAVVRSLSKAWGLAGCRVGYLLGPAALLAPLRAAGNPYAVAGPSLALACARLQHGGEVEAFVAQVRRERAGMAEQLRALGVGLRCDSQANFVLAEPASGTGLRALLWSLGIAVRAFPDEPALGEQVRITCPGDADAFARLLAALRTALAPQRVLLGRGAGGAAAPVPTAAFDGPATVDAVTGAAAGARAWLLSGEPAELRAARAAGVLPIGVGEDAAALHAAGTGIVLPAPTLLTTLFRPAP